MNQAQSRGVQHLVLALLPPLTVLLAFLMSSKSLILAPQGALPAPKELLAWILLGALAGLHRPFRPAQITAAAGDTGPTPLEAGEPLAGTLGLGAMVVAPVILRLGAVPASLVAAGTLVTIELLRRRVSSLGIGRAVALPSWGRVLERASWVGGAVLVTQWLVTAWPLTPTLDRYAYFPLACGGVLLATAVALPGLRGQGWPWRTLGPAVGLDVTALVLGALIADVATTSGWWPATGLLLALALLSAEAARNAQLRFHSDRKVDHLEKLTQMPTRMAQGEVSSMASIAEQILVECCNVLPVDWFHFETFGIQQGSWAAELKGGDPAKCLVEGRPHPPSRPKMLPGVHKRVEWQILDYIFFKTGEVLAEEDAADDTREPLARLRLWYDMRRLEDPAQSKQLFSDLLPLMASAVQQANLDREAKLDPLTGVPVRRLLDSRLQRVYRRACDDGLSMAVILCDIDFFKKVNDTYGHAAGDEALKLVAATLDQKRRDADLCCRYGGEEFAVLLEKTDGDAALRLAERLRRAVAALDFVYDGKKIPLTLSAGVAAFPELHIKTGSELLLLADEALYAAKHRGRNVCLLNCGNATFRAPTSDP